MGLGECDERLGGWVSPLLDGWDVSFALPVAEQAGPLVSLYLFDVARKAAPRGERPAPLQLLARYLVTTWAAEPRDTHEALGTLMFAALENAEYEVEGPAPGAWSALGIAPRPAFVLCTTVRRDRPQPDLDLVRRPLFLEAGRITSVHGRVLTPDDVPLAGARVELPATRALTTTDLQGRFRFPAVPAADATTVLAVTAKGRRRTFTSPRASTETDPLLIRFDPLEG